MSRPLWKSRTVLLLLSSGLDFVASGLRRRPLEVAAALWLAVVLFLGGIVGWVYLGRPDALVGLIIGGLLITFTVASVLLMTPWGPRRFGTDLVRTWFRVSAGSAGAVALAFLSGVASADASRVDFDMEVVAIAALTSFVCALLSLRRT